jgi:hypothetical protein
MPHPSRRQPNLVRPPVYAVPALADEQRLAVLRRIAGRWVLVLGQADVVVSVLFAVLAEVRPQSRPLVLRRRRSGSRLVTLDATREKTQDGPSSRGCSNRKYFTNARNSTSTVSANNG